MLYTILLTGRASLDMFICLLIYIAIIFFPVRFFIKRFKEKRRNEQELLKTQQQILKELQNRNGKAE